MYAIKPITSSLSARPPRTGTPNIAARVFAIGARADSSRTIDPASIVDRSRQEKLTLGESRERARSIVRSLEWVRKELADKAEKPTLIGGGSSQSELRARVETRDTFAVRDVVETRATYATRVLTEERDVFETRSITATRDVFETRDVLETRDIFETRDVMGASITGTRNLVQTAYQGWDDIGIKEGAQFTVRVGSGPIATIRFDKNERIKLTVDGQTTNFNFHDSNGNWRGGLLNALNRIDGLDARFNASGRLVMESEGPQSITLANGAMSPLDELGLSPGTRAAVAIGQETVKTGTEQVVIGQETIKVGTEEIIVGQEQVKIGTETVVVGSERARIGEETVTVGTQTVATGRAETIVGYDYVTSGASKAYEDRNWVSNIERDRLAGTLRAIDRTAGRTGLLAGDAERDRTGAVIEGVDLSTAGLGALRIGAMSSAAQVQQALKAVDAQIGRAEGLIERLDRAIGLDDPMTPPSSRVDAAIAVLDDAGENDAPRSEEAAIQLARRAADNLRELGREGLGREGLGFGRRDRSLWA